MIPAKHLNEAELIADLRTTYPNLHVSPLREYYGVGHDWKSKAGAWIGGEDDACMADGLPIFVGLYCDQCDEYDGGVHKVFTAWLETRGWYLECEDYGVFMAVSISETKEVVKAYPDKPASWVTGVVGLSPSFDLPF